MLDNIREGNVAINQVIDIAGGNLRFERFCQANGFEKTQFLVVDSCPELAESETGITVQILDVVECLLHQLPVNEVLRSVPSQLVVSFGFMHHIPIEQIRIDFLRQLVYMAEPGGYVAVTFWQFARNPINQAKAEATTRDACGKFGLHLDANDYILGWKDTAGAYRYCHSFTDGEVLRAIESVSDCAALDDCYSSDGKTGDMNKYVVLRRK